MEINMSTTSCGLTDLMMVDRLSTEMQAWVGFYSCGTYLLNHVFINMRCHST